MVMRVGGMASGIDTESIIGVLLDAEKVSINRWEERIEDNEDKYLAWTELEGKISDLRSVVSDLKSYTTWNQYSAMSSDEDVFTSSASLSASKGTYSIDVRQLAQNQRIASDAQTDTTSALNLSGNFTIGGETVSVTTDQSLEDIRDAINTAALDMDADEQVQSYLIGNSLVIERVKTGDTDIDISETSVVSGDNDVLRSLGLLSGNAADTGTFSTVKNETQTSEDLDVRINGVQYTGSSNSDVTDAISGVTLNFKSESTATLTVGADTDTIKSYIEDFVEKYNDTMKLAKTQGSANLDDAGDVSTFGLLQGDLLLADINVKMRSLLSQQIDDPSVADPDFNSLYTIGVWFNSESNELSIDEEKLDEALDNNLDEVEYLFRAYGTDQSDGGVIRQLDNYIDSLLDPIDGRITNKEERLETDISDLEQRINDKNAWLVDYEAELWEHFARMEEAVSSINSQWQYVSGALGVS
jgi:flagellar hook-associated protein 2